MAGRQCSEHVGTEEGETPGQRVDWSLRAACALEKLTSVLENIGRTPRLNRSSTP
jgi:hypothetical protein